MCRYVAQLDSHVIIRKENFRKVYETLLDFAEEGETLDDVFHCMGFNVKYDSGGDIAAIWYKEGSDAERDPALDDAWLSTIASCVEDGSYLSIISDAPANRVWRWYFNGRHLWWYAGKITFPSCERFW